MRRSRSQPPDYTLCLPVWYRAANEVEWHTGLSRRVSTTGAIIRADEPGTPCDQLIVVIGLPSSHGCLVGHGQVIQLLKTDDADETATFAVQVPGYHLDKLTQVLRAVVTSG